MLLEPRSNDEFVAPPPTPVAAEAARRAYASAREAGLSRRQFLRSTFGTALALAALAAVCLFGLKLGLLRTLGVTAAAGLVLRRAGL